MLSLVSLISCGSQKPMVDDINVTTSTVNGDIILNLSADLSIGNLQMPSASFPIILPRIGKQVGQISLLTTPSGVNQLLMEVNVSEAANLDLTSVRLPNGSMIPLIGDNAVLEVPVGKVVVYLSLAEGAQALGIAVPIKTFDAIGRKVGSASMMPLFNKNGVMGAAGIFTSKTAGQNGFALVADISSKLGSISIPNANLIQMEQAPLDFSSASPSRRIKKKLNKELYKLNKRRKRLQLR